jgi:hypothetical protein
MRVRHCLLVVLWGFVLLLGACTTLSPTYVFTEHTDTTYTTHHRELACGREIRFDAGEAYNRNELPLLWTFQVNFDVTSDLTAEGRPLGCLRLYARSTDEAVPEYQEIDAAGIIVDTCERIGSPLLLDIEDGTATLDGDGYVACEMNLAEWVPSLAGRTEFSTHTDLLTSFVPSPIHEYPNFTMAALVTLTPIIDSMAIEDMALNPLIYYEPSDASQAAVDLSVYVVNNGGVTFPAEECLSFGVCQSHDIDTEVVWWYDYRTEEEEELPYLEYLFQDGSGRSDPWRAPDDAVPPAPEAGKNAHPFWIGPAILYIGHNPQTEDSTHGIIDGVLVDPSDSKPTE